MDLPLKNRLFPQNVIEVAVVAGPRVTLILDLFAREVNIQSWPRLTGWGLSADD
jgi:hypothetical protein